MPGPHSSATTSPTQHRTRQGCLSCRKRRRKCDEGKPRCQNCSERGISCRYGVRLTFRESNLLNLMPGDAEALREITPANYTHIRFVDGFEDSEQVADDEPDAPHSVRSSPKTNVSLPVQSEGSTERNPRPPQTPAQEYFHGQDDGIALHQDVIESSLVEERQSQPPIVYPSAVGHTYSVPTHNSPNQVQRWSEIVPEQPSPQVLLPTRGWGPTPRTDAAFGGSWRPLSALSQTSNSPAQRGGASPIQSLPVHERNGLLKFYIDKVAPRLDICTPRSSFGITIPTEARNYKPLLYAVLALAAQQRSACPRPESSHASSQSYDLTRSAIASIGPDMYSSREEVVAARTLLLISDLFSARIRYWRDVLKERVGHFEGLGVDGFSDGLRGSASWVTLRLDLAHSISSWTPLLTPVEKWRKTSLSNPHDTHVFSLEQSRSPEWTRRSILLCSQAAQLCLSAENTNVTAPQSSTIVSWTTLHHSIRSWSESLPSSMHPILTSPISLTLSTPPYSFPLILYTSRPNMYAAIMHHTASILLLQGKPPGTQPSYSLRSTTWHAVQICGICIGNNAPWSHDPTILAVLIYVGRFVSYHEQRKELLESVQTLVRDSGWQLGESVEQMVDGWRADSGFQAR